MLSPRKYLLANRHKKKQNHDFSTYKKVFLKKYLVLFSQLADIASAEDIGPSSLALNWVTKQLYWPEPDGIYMYEASLEEATAQKVKVVDIAAGSKVVGVGVNPLQRCVAF